MPRFARHVFLPKSFGAIGFALLLAVPALASGSGGYKRDVKQSRTDPTYELGRSIYHGRSKSARGFEVCLAPDAGSEDQEPVALSRRGLRPFKERALLELTTRLVDCADPASHAARALDASEFQALVYYLNKRFSLKLAN
jgi:hypothetical protein